RQGRHRRVHRPAMDHDRYKGAALPILKGVVLEAGSHAAQCKKPRVLTPSSIRPMSSILTMRPTHDLEHLRDVHPRLVRKTWIVQQRHAKDDAPVGVNHRESTVHRPTAGANAP